MRAVTSPAPAASDPILLERLAQNMLDNAIRYNIADGGWARVTGRIGDDAYLKVENTGPVVPSDDVAGLFEPFRRLGTDGRLADANLTPPGRGAGLGLSIVRSVAHATAARYTPTRGSTAA